MSGTRGAAARRGAHPPRPLATPQRPRPAAARTSSMADATIKAAIYAAGAQHACAIAGSPVARRGGRAAGGAGRATAGGAWRGMRERQSLRRQTVSGKRKKAIEHKPTPTDNNDPPHCGRCGNGRRAQWPARRRSPVAPPAAPPAAPGRTHLAGARKMAGVCLKRGRSRTTCGITRQKVHAGGQQTRRRSSWRRRRRGAARWRRGGGAGAAACSGRAARRRAPYQRHRAPTSVGPFGPQIGA